MKFQNTNVWTLTDEEPVDVEPIPNLRLQDRSLTLKVRAGMLVVEIYDLYVYDLEINGEWMQLEKVVQRESLSFQPQPETTTAIILHGIENENVKNETAMKFLTRFFRFFCFEDSKQESIQRFFPKIWEHWTKLQAVTIGEKEVVIRFTDDTTFNVQSNEIVDVELISNQKHSDNKDIS